MMRSAFHSPCFAPWRMKIRRHPLLLDATWMDKYKYDDSEKMWEEEKACGRLAVFVGLTRTNTQPGRATRLTASDQKKEVSLFCSSPNNGAVVHSEDKRKRKQNKNRQRGKMSDGTRRHPTVVVARFETVWLDSWKYHDAECLFELRKEEMAGRPGGNLPMPPAYPVLQAEVGCHVQDVVDELNNRWPRKHTEALLGTSSMDADMVDTDHSPTRCLIIEALTLWVDKFIFEKAEEAYYVQKYVEQVDSGSPDNEKPEHRYPVQQMLKAATIEYYDIAKYATLESVWLQNALYHDAEVRYHEREATQHLKALQRARASVVSMKMKKSKRQKQMKTYKPTTNELKQFAEKPLSVQISGLAFKEVIGDISDPIAPNPKMLCHAEDKLIRNIPRQPQTSPCVPSHRVLATTTMRRAGQQQQPLLTMAAIPQLQEGIWVDKFRYDDAECQYQQQLALPSRKEAKSSGILQDIQRARNNIQKSLAGAVPEGGELLPRLKVVEQENQELKKHLQALQQALFRVEARLSTLEKGSAGSPPTAVAASKPVQVKVMEEVNGNAQEDDDIDLFGSDEDDGEAEKLREERVKAYSEKKSKKPALIAKSSIVLDVKPWDDETDMAELEAKVRSVSMDGLLWGASKLMPVGYGIKKLQIQCVVEDDKVGTDILEEEITKFEDHVQSVDVAAFNKI